jgi:hypothetical protein
MDNDCMECKHDLKWIDEYPCKTCRRGPDGDNTNFEPKDNLMKSEDKNA